MFITLTNEHGIFTLHLFDGSVLKGTGTGNTLAAALRDLAKEVSA